MQGRWGLRKHDAHTNRQIGVHDCLKASKGAGFLNYLDSLTNNSRGLENHHESGEERMWLEGPQGQQLDYACEGTGSACRLLYR